MPGKLLDNLDVGMVLSHDLLNGQGHLLLPAGSVLTAQHLRILKQWHIEVVYVEASESGNPPWCDASVERLTSEMHRDNEAGLSQLFQFCPREHEFTSRLYYILLDRLDRLSVLDLDS
ncbi:MAG: hypothetical protein KDC10_03165 [Calditrichaeota bacterium]|nr:hypothetical protein [Candidatus Cloacimonadota bacterium]MCB1046177.1 hypothetical protein [Calditrichota bacterium]